MTKLRDPASLYDALDQAIGYLGIERVAAIVGKGEGLVRKWADPDADYNHMPFEAGLKLDVALVREGYPTVFAALAEHVVREALRIPGAAAAAEPRHAQISRIVCSAAGTLDDFVKAEESNGIDASERVRLLADTETLQKRVAVFRRALFVKPHGDTRRKR